MNGETNTANLSGSAGQELQEPYPPRYRNLKRWFRIALVVVLGLVGLRIWWGYEASKRLNARIDALRQQGIPILPGDFNRPPIPDEENAAFYIQQAIAMRDPIAESPAETPLIYREYPPYPPEWHRLATEAVKANTAALDHLRKARNCDQVWWNLQFGSPVNGANVMATMSILNSSRGLANLASDAALEAHLRGDDAAALEYLRDVHALGDAVGQQPFVVSYLVGIGIGALADSRLQVIARVLAGPGNFVGGADRLKVSSRKADDSRGSPGPPLIVASETAHSLRDTADNTKEMRKLIRPIPGVGGHREGAKRIFS